MKVIYAVQLRDLLSSSLVGGIRVDPRSISQKLNPFIHLFIQEIHMKDLGSDKDKVVIRLFLALEELAFRCWGR